MYYSLSFLLKKRNGNYDDSDNKFAESAIKMKPCIKASRLLLIRKTIKGVL